MTEVEEQEEATVTRISLYTNPGPGRAERRWARKNGQLAQDMGNRPARLLEDGTYSSWE